MGYKIIYAGDTESLAELVCLEILDGWRPQGGVCTYHIRRDRSVWFCQAMVRP